MQFGQNKASAFGAQALQHTMVNRIEGTETEQMQTGEGNQQLSRHVVNIQSTQKQPATPYRVDQPVTRLSGENTVSTLTNNTPLNFGFATIASVEQRKEEIHVLIKRVQDWTKHNLFSKIKFIQNDDMLQFSTNEKSICQIVCRAHNVIDARKQKWFWQDHGIGKEVRCAIKIKRSDATTAIKNGFMGKKCFN